MGTTANPPNFFARRFYSQETAFLSVMGQFEDWYGQDTGRGVEGSQNLKLQGTLKKTSHESSNPASWRRRGSNHCVSQWTLQE